VHDRVVVAVEVTKNLRFSLNARGRKGGKETHVFEDEEGDGALRSTERCGELDTGGITPVDSVAHWCRCGYTWAAWGMIPKEDRKE
jgi:hypothetical protein